MKHLRDKLSMNMNLVEYPVMLSDRSIEWMQNVYEVGIDYISSLEKIILLPITLTVNVNIKMYSKPERNAENQDRQAKEILPERHNAEADGGLHYPPVGA